MQRYEWALLSEDELTTRVWAAFEAETTPATLERLITRQYAIVMYEACQQTEYPARRERGYQELFRFLYRAAYKRWPDLAGVVAHRGLMLVHQQLDRCYSPITFFGFAFNKLRQAFTEEQRARAKIKDISWEMIEGDRLAVEPLQARLSQIEHLQVLVAAINRLPNEREQKVILGKFFEGLSDQEIAVRLGIKAGHVRKLRHTGLNRLRQDQQLQDYFDLPSEKGEAVQSQSDLSTNKPKQH
jgi:RNA polymerase sigma factor (sigma-70 family)